MITLKEPSAEQIKEEKLYQKWGLSDEEFNKITTDLGRLPNYTETGLFSVMWSEHCSYKNSKSILKQFPTEGPQVLQGPGEGAGIVDIGDDLAVVFKAESHNHPSAVEPYEGAATGVGGIIRDIFSMGARPIALLDSLRFGELTEEKTKYLLSEVVAGIGGYGNCIGIPTVGGEVAFDPCYRGNPLVNAMCVGLIEHRYIQKGQAKGTGNTIMYVGAKTGRDGIHGATFASEEFSEEGEQQRSAVQVGDPFMEKLLLEACLTLIHECPEELIGIQDMGAAGLVSSSSEMASKAGSGVELYLDQVPQRETQMSPYEIMLSESQERMLICVKNGCEQKIQTLFSTYDLEASVIGQVTDDGMYRLYHQEQQVAEIPVAALTTDVPSYRREAQRPERMSVFEKMHAYVPQIEKAEETLLSLLAQPTIASKKSIYETYDAQVMTNTVVLPGSDAAVVRVRGTNKCLAMTMDCNSRYLYLDPEIGGQMAVAEAARNIVASGGRPLAITDCLNYGSPENPEGFWELETSARGISTACEMFETPVISGNVSLYNETDGKAIYPTPIIGMVGLIEDPAFVTTQAYKKPGDLIYLVGETSADFNGSELQKLQLGKISGNLRPFDLSIEKQNQDLVANAIRSGMITSAHDCSEGGLAVALCEAAFPNDFGIEVAIDMETSLLFAETPSRFIVTIQPKDQERFDSTFGERAVLIGRVTSDPEIRINTQTEVLRLATKEAKQRWEEAIPCHMKSKG